MTDVGQVGAAELALMLLGDARLPSGGHVHSAGLEAALLAGMPPADVPAYLTTRLLTTGVVDAGTGVLALAGLRGGDSDGLETVVREWGARTPSRVQRDAAVAVGRGYLRLLRLTWPDVACLALLDHLGDVPRPVVLAAYAHVLGLSAEQLVRLMCHDEVQSITSAALKLAPSDPVDTVAWALAAQPTVHDVVRRVAHLTDPAELPAPTAPLIEVWVQTHAEHPRRLFRA